jgi:hypothetical protein
MIPGGSEIYKAHNYIILINSLSALKLSKLKANSSIIVIFYRRRGIIIDSGTENHDALAKYRPVVPASK